MVYYGPVWRKRMRVAPEIVLTREEQTELKRLAHSKVTSVRLAQRARIVLLVSYR